MAVMVYFLGHGMLASAVAGSKPTSSGIRAFTDPVRARSPA
jgi:hypothetical protein